MPKKKVPEKLSKPRWMTECDVIRYSMQMPQELKEQIKKEASEKGMDMSSYICGLLSGEIRRKQGRK
jgi:predicted DNA binding CopG/RHH family protein